MRLQLLCEMDFSYRPTPTDDGPFKYVVPYGTQEASVCGVGDAVFRGAGGTTSTRIFVCEADLD